MEYIYSHEYGFFQVIVIVNTRLDNSVRIKYGASSIGLSYNEVKALIKFDFLGCLDELDYDDHLTAVKDYIEGTNLGVEIDRDTIVIDKPVTHLLIFPTEQINDLIRCLTFALEYKNDS